MERVKWTPGSNVDRVKWTPGSDVDPGVEIEKAIYSQTILWGGVLLRWRGRSRRRWNRGV